MKEFVFTRFVFLLLCLFFVFVAMLSGSETLRYTS